METDGASHTWHRYWSDRDVGMVDETLQHRRLKNTLRRIHFSPHRSPNVAVHSTEADVSMLVSKPAVKTYTL
ncbi:unnamed protein product [Timema podura]|uniref:Uncharacterized protein n=1 Tax=Timema podura TaxID=61482 RepID=A0ABN7NUI4_TIMPD|nr:unnamed protein product [Timema podura]